MSAGDRWLLPDGRHGIELARIGQQLKVAPIVEGWPWPAPPIVAWRPLCVLQPSRYLAGAVPVEGGV